MVVNNIVFKCCFCDKIIKSTHLDVTNIFVTTNWNKLEGNQWYNQFFCHLMCFKEKLDPQVPLYLEFLGDDEGYDDDRTEEEVRESLEQMLKPASSEVLEAAALQRKLAANDPTYQCCFCSNAIESSVTGVTSLLVTINWDKEVERQQDQQFFCHFNCLSSDLSI